jgi:hypothetical protein
VVTGVEEFGIAAVEVQAAGRPVIARSRGGVLETVVDGVTGRLWDGGVDELAEAVRSFDAAAIDSRACVENAARFDSAAFRDAFPRQVGRALAAAGGAIGAEHDDPPRPRDGRPRFAPRPWPVARMRGAGRRG